MKRRWIRAISMLTAAVLLAAGLPVSALAGSEEVIVEEEDGYSSSVVFEEEDGEEMSLEALAEEYAPVDNDTAGTEYKIIYVMEDGVALSDSAAADIEATGNDRISIGADKTVTQTFEAGSADALAPLVYSKEGKTVGNDQTWKLTYSESYVIPGESGGESTTGTRTVTKYFPSDAKVSDVQSYADGNKVVHLYPNWVEPNITYDIESLRGAVNPNSSIVRYDTGRPVILAPITENIPDKTVFDGWSYKFGNGEITDAAPVEGDTTGKQQIDTTGHYGSELLTIYANFTVSEAAVVFDTDSLGGKKNPNEGITSYVPGKNVILDPLDDRSDREFIGWSYKFGDGEYTAAADDNGRSVISTVKENGKKHTETLTIKAVWLKAEIPLLLMTNIDNLHKIAQNARVLNRNGREMPGDRIETKYYDVTPLLYSYENFYTDAQGFEQIGWSYTSEAPDGKPDHYLFDGKNTRMSEVAKDAFLKGYFNGEENEPLTLYATWGYKTYSISYDSVIDDPKGLLPRMYNIGENLTLPTAEEMNKGEIAPRFSSRLEFKYWTTSKNGTNEIKSLGKDGDIQSGNLTLFAKYEQIVGGGDDEDPKITKDREFNAYQKHFLNILNAYEQLVICFKPSGNGKALRVDPRNIRLVEADDEAVADLKNKPEGSKYWEVCAVDTDRASIERGYTCVGLRLKKSVLEDESIRPEEIVKNDKIAFRVRGIDDSTGEYADHYTIVTTLLNINFTVPQYKLDKSKIDLNGIPGNSATVRMKEKSKEMSTDKNDGEWELDFVRTGDTQPLDFVTVKTETNDCKTEEVVLSISDITRLTNKEKIKGNIRIRNTKWYPRKFCNIGFDIGYNADKQPKLTLSKSQITLNNTVSNESDEVRLMLDGAGEVDMSMTTWESTATDKGVKIEKDPEKHALVITGKKGIKTGNYNVKVKYSNPAYEKDSIATLKIVVSNIKNDKGATFKIAGGAIYAAGDSQVFIEPTVKGFAGEIKSVAIKKNVKCSENGKFIYKVKWDGRYVILTKSPDYVFQEGGYQETIRLTMSTGNYVYGKIKIVPKTGTVDLEIPDTDIYSGSDPAGYVPVVWNYNYQYYTSPSRVEFRTRAIDANNEKILYQTGTKKPVERYIVSANEDYPMDTSYVTGRYNARDGIITFRVLPLESGQKRYPVNFIKFSGINGLTGKGISTSFALRIK